MYPAIRSSKIFFSTIFVFSYVILSVTVTGYTIKPTANPGTVLQNQLDKMNNRLDQIDIGMVEIMFRLSYLESYKSDIGTIEKKLDAADKSIKHLQSVNQIWKSNFKSIRDSFGKLRERVAFTVPTIDL